MAVALYTPLGVKLTNFRVSQIEGISLRSDVSISADSPRAHRTPCQTFSQSENVTALVLNVG